MSHFVKSALQDIKNIRTEQYRAICTNMLILADTISCNDGEEIAAGLECDGNADCSDESDEDPFVCVGGKSALLMRQNL